MADEISSNPVSGEDPWLTVQQVGEELKLHPATVRIWIKNGRLGAVRVGREWRIRRSDLDRALMADASPAYAEQPSGSSAAEVQPVPAPTPAPRQIADHIMAVGPATQDSG